LFLWIGSQDAPRNEAVSDVPNGLVCCYTFTVGYVHSLKMWPRAAG